MWVSYANSNAVITVGMLMLNSQSDGYRVDDIVPVNCIPTTTAPASIITRLEKSLKQLGTKKQMAQDYHKIKHINQDIQNCVNGFMRECRQQLPKDNQYYDIPSLIIYTCMLYYHIVEYFTDAHGPNIILLDNNSIAAIKQGQNTINGVDYDAAFGNIKIEFDKKYIYQWIFKIIKFVDIPHLGDEIVIGITHKRTRAPNGDFDYAFHLAQFASYTVAYRCDGDIFPYDEIECAKYDENDTVKMELNTENMTLQFYVNDEPQPLYEGLNFESENALDVHMAVSMDSDNPNAVKLLNFDIISSSPHV